MTRPLQAEVSEWLARSRRSVAGWSSRLRVPALLELSLANHPSVQRVLALLAKSWPLVSGSQADSRHGLPDTDLDQVDWAAMPRQPGWHRNDWLPEVAGPIQVLTVHCQSQPDATDPSVVVAEPASPWRFEVVVNFSSGATATIVGRLSLDGLRLLIRSDRGLAPGMRAHLADLVDKMRLNDGRPVSARFDTAQGSAGALTPRAGVDRRA